MSRKLLRLTMGGGPMVGGGPAQLFNIVGDATKRAVGFAKSFVGPQMEEAFNARVKEYEDKIEEFKTSIDTYGANIIKNPTLSGVLATLLGYSIGFYACGIHAPLTMTTKILASVVTFTLPFVVKKVYVLGIIHTAVDTLKYIFGTLYYAGETGLDTVGKAVGPWKEAVKLTEQGLKARWQYTLDRIVTASNDYAQMFVTALKYDIANDLDRELDIAIEREFKDQKPDNPSNLNDPSKKYDLFMHLLTKEDDYKALAAKDIHSSPLPSAKEIMDITNAKAMLEWLNKYRYEEFMRLEEEEGARAARAAAKKAAAAAVAASSKKTDTHQILGDDGKWYRTILAAKIYGKTKGGARHKTRKQKRTNKHKSRKHKGRR